LLIEKRLKSKKVPVQETKKYFLEGYMKQAVKK